MKVQNVGNQLSKVSSEVIIPVPSSKSRLWLKPTDQMDTWLDSQGFYRKHIARDASSLFRCVSEKIFLTQVHHLTVRKHCIQFALNNPDVFQRLTCSPIREYVDRLHNQRDWGIKLDMEIMSLMYQIDFFMYKEIKKPVEEMTSNSFGPYIILSLSFEHHYDSVYPKQHIMNAAICQSIFYEILYKCVFKLEEVDYAVSRMLHDKTARLNNDLSVTFFSTGFQMRLEMRDNCRNVKDLLNCGITPFPYKVAKSLDPNIYRNVEYDTWNEQKKGSRHGLTMWNNRELQVGSRCIINFTEPNNVIKRHGYIQQMSPDKGPVIVFIEELGEKLTVPFESLEVLPSSNTKQSEENLDYRSETSSNGTSPNCKNIEARFENDITVSGVKQEERTGPLAEFYSAHFTHATSTCVQSTGHSCVPSSSSVEPTNFLRAPPASLRTNPTEDFSKVSYCASTNDIVNNQFSSVPISYQMPVYPVMSQDAQTQQAVVPAPIPKQPASTDFVDGSSMRLVYSHSVDPYYRYGLPNYPYYIVAPNYGFSQVADSAYHQNTDVPRTSYPPASYPVSAVSNELYYAMPVSSANKVETPLYHAQMIYPPHVKKMPRNFPGSAEGTNVESVYRTKDSASIKETIPITSPAISNIYPVTYPPVYYHSYECCSTCPEIQPYENINPMYPPPQFVPLTYPEHLYQTNAPVICQPTSQ